MAAYVSSPPRPGTFTTTRRKMAKDASRPPRIRKLYVRFSPGLHGGSLNLRKAE